MKGKKLTFRVVFEEQDGSLNFNDIKGYNAESVVQDFEKQNKLRVINIYVK